MYKSYGLNAFIILPLVCLIMCGISVISIIFFIAIPIKIQLIFILCLLLSIVEIFRIKKIEIGEENVIIIGLSRRIDIKKGSIRKITIEKQFSRFGLFNEILIISMVSGEKVKLPGIYIKNFKEMTNVLKSFGFPISL